jgi:hypothetical protein
MPSCGAPGTALLAGLIGYDIKWHVNCFSLRQNSLRTAAAHGERRASDAYEFPTVQAPM